MKSHYISLAFLLLLAAASAVAASPQPEIIPVPPPVAAFAAPNPDCLEWTDSCAVCRRGPDNELACSTPGIACQAGGVVCTETRKNSGP